MKRLLKPLLFSIAVVLMAVGFYFSNAYVLTTGVGLIFLAFFIPHSGYGNGGDAGDANFAGKQDEKLEAADSIIGSGGDGGSAGCGGGCGSS